MKKSLLLVAVLALAASSNAEVKTWDFTNWSAETVANLKAEAAKGSTVGAWSDVEKAADAANGADPTETSKDNCFWMVSDVEGGLDSDGNLAANGTAIAETKGLKFINTNTRNLAIAVNYPEALSTYKGGAYLWLGGSGKNYFVIPDVPAGATIKMGVESHKTTDARGVNLFVGSSEGEKLLGTDGKEVEDPMEYTEQEWLVPTTATSTDIQIQNTNGCHLYYITVIPAGEAAGVEAVAVESEVVSTEIYTISGVKVAELIDGINIVRTTYANGTVKTVKVVK